MKSFIRLAALALVLVVPARATWSIVVVNTLTREVAVATATCIEGPGIDTRVPVIVVEKGAGAAQAFVLSTAFNRKKIFNGFMKGREPWDILRRIGEKDWGFKDRQFGIVGLEGEPVTWTGTSLNAFIHQWAGGLTGEVGELRYAIQGNVLTGAPVVLEAERALLETPGDLSTKVMAAMEAAREMGGDGRCSCFPTDADKCGSPPPDFDKSAHTIAYMLARPGDVDGICNGDDGCANGDYYLSFSFGNYEGDPDPVELLQVEYDLWRAALSGIPDHYASHVDAAAQSLPADGQASTRVTVSLADVDGVPLTIGGHQLVVRQASEGPATAVPGPVSDHGDGTYSFDLVATTTPGRGAWAVEVATGTTRVIRLWPPVVVQTDPLEDLHVGLYDLHPDNDLGAPFTLNRGSAEAGRPYKILGSAAGTVPGIPFRGVTIPLNRDRLLEFTWTKNDPSQFRGSAGTLDADGRASAWLRLPPPVWSSFAGERLHFTALLGGASDEVTNLVSFRVLP